MCRTKTGRDDRGVVDCTPPYSTYSRSPRRKRDAILFRSIASAAADGSKPSTSVPSANITISHSRNRTTGFSFGFFFSCTIAARRYRIILCTRRRRSIFGPGPATWTCKRSSVAERERADTGEKSWEIFSFGCRTACNASAPTFARNAAALFFFFIVSACTATCCYWSRRAAAAATAAAKILHKIIVAAARSVVVVAAARQRIRGRFADTSCTAWADDGVARSMLYTLRFWARVCVSVYVCMCLCARAVFVLCRNARACVRI